MAMPQDQATGRISAPNGHARDLGLAIVGTDGASTEPTILALSMHGQADAIDTDRDDLFGPPPAKEAGTAPRRVEPAVKEAPNDPYRLAHAILGRFDHPDGPTLAYYRDEFYTWDGAAYRPDPDFRLAVLSPAIKEELDRLYREAIGALQREQAAASLAPGKGRPTAPPVVPQVTRTLVGNVADALASLVIVPYSAEAPCWRTQRSGDPDPARIMVARNGLLDLGDDEPTLRPHTPRLFALAALPFDYDPDAPLPARWIGVLDDQWADDPESFETLHEVIGYLLTPDTRFYKMFLLIGPPRSGKSAIKEVVTALLGERNVASTSAKAMGGEFGLQPLLGKSVAIMGDSRTGDANESATLLDRVLRITGDDPVEVNRKGKPILPQIRLATRLLMLSNELPNFRDPSNAITARYLILQTPNTIPPERRDPDLIGKLQPELPGILNLAIEGRRRLYRRGRFIQPESAADLLDMAQEIASPVAEFVRDCLVIDPAESIPTLEAFRLWESWAKERGYASGNTGTFGRNLKAALGGKLPRGRPRSRGHAPIYKGIGRRPDADCPF